MPVRALAAKFWHETAPRKLTTIGDFPATFGIFEWAAGTVKNPSFLPVLPPKSKPRKHLFPLGCGSSPFPASLTREHQKEVCRLKRVRALWETTVGTGLLLGLLLCLWAARYNLPFQRWLHQRRSALVLESCRRPSLMTPRWAPFCQSIPRSPSLPNASISPSLSVG